jgi:hypothetical protein
MPTRSLRIVILVLLGAGLMACAATKEREKVTATKPLPKGISTWAYRYAEGMVKQVKRFNEQASPDMRFRYYFAYGLAVDFDKEKRKINTHYRADTIGAYAKALPSDVLLMPIVDGRTDEGQFEGWTEAEYQEGARAVAQLVLEDPNAKGVQVDIEPFSPGQLPFFRALREALNAKGKYSTIFVGPWDEETMKLVFASCDAVVLSGYDLNGEGHSPESYRKALERGLARVQKAAEASGGRYLVGIPAAASWGEFEYAAGGDTERKEGGGKQEEYVKAALEAVKPYRQKPECLGLSLWHMSDTETDREDPEKAKPGTKFPNLIRESVWKLLREEGR